MSNQPKEIPPRNPHYRGRYASTFPEGVAEIDLPWWMGTESLDDLEKLFAIIIRQLRRNASRIEEDQPAQPQSEEPKP